MIIIQVTNKKVAKAAVSRYMLLRCAWWYIHNTGGVVSAVQIDQSQTTGARLTRKAAIVFGAGFTFYRRLQCITHVEKGHRGYHFIRSLLGAKLCNALAIVLE